MQYYHLAWCRMKNHKGTVVTDEIANDFSKIGIPYARDLFLCGWITQEQFELAQGIEEKLEQMTQKKESWKILKSLKA